MFIETKDIIGKAESLGNIKTFIKMIRKAGMEEMLRGVGPFTVFAPADNAFYVLPPNDVRDLLNDAAACVQFVQYHILANRRIRSTEIVDREAVPNLMGKTLSFNSGPAYHFIVNDVPVLTPDIECSNGIIHIINSQLAPR
jgi:uncharacterized surface protein with fasciclin (FAS1) repeats